MTGFLELPAWTCFRRRGLTLFSRRFFIADALFGSEAIPVIRLVDCVWCRSFSRYLIHRDPGAKLDFMAQLLGSIVRRRVHRGGVEHRPQSPAALGRSRIPS